MNPFWMYLNRGTSVLLSGDEEVGKTTLLYNFALHAATNTKLWGVPFDGMLRVLYLDKVSHDEDRDRMMNSIIPHLASDPSGSFDTRLGTRIELSQSDDLDYLEGLTREGMYNLVILDPVKSFFNPDKEVAQANRRMRSLKKVAQATNACIISVVTNTEEYGDTTENRRAAADDIIEVSRRGNLIRFRLLANEYQSASIYLRQLDQDTFEPTDFAEWQAARV